MASNHAPNRKQVPKARREKMTTRPESTPVWLTSAELEYIVQLIGDYDPHRLVKTFEYARKLLANSAERVRELAARARVGSGYEETEEEMERLKSLKKQRREQSKSARFLAKAESMPVEELERLLQQLKQQASGG